MVLEGLGVSTSTWDPLLLHVLLKKLDRSSHIVYEQLFKDPKAVPTIKWFLDILKSQFQSLEAVSNRERHYTSLVYTVQSGIASTLYIQGIFALSTSDRLNLVKSNHLCLSCLKGGNELYIQDMYKVQSQPQHSCISIASKTCHRNIMFKCKTGLIA